MLPEEVSSLLSFLLSDIVTIWSHKFTDVSWNLFLFYFSCICFTPSSKINIFFPVWTLLLYQMVMIGQEIGSILFWHILMVHSLLWVVQSSQDTNIGTVIAGNVSQSADGELTRALSCRRITSWHWCQVPDAGILSPITSYLH